MFLEEREWWAVASAIAVSRGVAREEWVETVELQSAQLPREFARVGRRRGVDPAEVDRAVRDLRDLGATILYPEHPLYPRAFRELEKPPSFLSCIGDPAVLSAGLRLAVVGSRELSVRTERWMDQHLSHFIRETGVTVMSGGARGADQAAHLAAVRAGRPTAVFLPSGLSRIFPADLSEWVKPILDSGGVLVSAYAPQETVRKFRFEARNRLIVSASHGVFVTEASRRSGSMMTARLAGELGRPIAVLPSFPGDVAGQGTLDLMIDGEARCIRDPLDLKVFVGGLIPGAAERPTSSDCEERVGGPHGDVRGQLTFS